MLDKYLLSNISQLFKEKNWEKYEAFFLLTNDTELYPVETINTLITVLEEHPMIGILSPASKNWGEINLLKDLQTKYFWFIHNNALLLRRKFIESIMEKENPYYLNFIFDGNNFRGYLTESEIIAKAYANNWAAAITTKVFAEENESYLIDKSDLIRTEDFFENRELYLEDIIGANVDAFSYPYGEYTFKLNQLGFAEGYQSLFSSSHGIANKNDQILPRNSINSNMSWDDIITILEPGISKRISWLVEDKIKIILKKTLGFENYKYFRTLVGFFLK